MLRFWKPLRRASIALAGAMALSACGDPLADFDQYTDLNISEETRPVAALPESVPKDGPIGPLAELAGAQDTPAPVDATVEDAVDTALASIDAKAEERKASGGLLGWLRRQAEEAEATTNTATDRSPDAATDEDVGAVAAENKKDSVVEVVEKSAEAEPVVTVEKAEPVQVASLAPEPLIEAVEEPRQKPKRRGLLGSPAAMPKSNGIARDVEYGTVLPFGEVGRVCESRARPLGQRVEKSETRGVTYSLFDTAPSGAGPRTFYVTGFADKCPRQFTAAMAMFGMPAMHEQLRYGKPSTQYPYSDTDRAYEQLKRRVCGVGPKKPCGAKIETLQRDTVFISTYENFSGTGRWADVLIHDSRVLASAIKKIGDPTQ